MPDETRLLTYAQLAAARGITVNAAKNLARGKRWQRALGNDGQARIHVPLEMLPQGPLPGPLQVPPHGALQVSSQGPSQRALDLLAEHITRLQGELDTLRALPAQVGALQAALEAAREAKAATDARLEATEAGRERMRAERDDARAERDRLLTREHLREQRRWWRRLAG